MDEGPGEEPDTDSEMDHKHDNDTDSGMDSKHNDDTDSGMDSKHNGDTSSGMDWEHSEANPECKGCGLRHEGDEYCLCTQNRRA